MYRVRVRGIYATAISLLLHEEGFLLSDVSEVLRSRLRIPESLAPPQVTVKSLDDDKDDVLVIGYPWEAGARVEEALRSSLPYITARRGRLGLYTVVDAVSLGGCRARIEGLEAVVASDDCPPEGEVFRATVVKESLEKGSAPRLRPGASVIGEYVIASAPGSGTSFSEHIRDRELRTELMLKTIESVDITRVHVRFRSNAKNAPVDRVVMEASRLAREVLGLSGEKPSGEGIVRRGEYISILTLASPAKRVLDEYRRRVVTTITWHHSLKAGGPEESMIVDYSELIASSGSCSSDIGGEALRFVSERLSTRPKASIRHKLPDGRAYTLGPYRVASVSSGGGCVRLTLERTFRSGGVLDGLNVVKRPGDRGVTEVDTCSWITLHTYTSREGKLLGYYANINTPPEISSTGVRYLDLYIDVVRRPGEEPVVIDEEELDKAREEGYIGEDLYREAREWASKAVNRLRQMP